MNKYRNRKIWLRILILCLVAAIVGIPAYNKWTKTLTLASTFGNLDFTGGNNEYQYPDYITVYEGYEIASSTAFDSPRIEEFYSLFDVVMIYRSKIEYGGDRDWYFHQWLAAAYYRFGDNANSLAVYDQIYSATGTCDRFTPGGLHQYARLLISKGRFEDAESLVANDSGWEIVNYGIKHKVLSITNYNRGRFFQALYHYIMYSYSKDYYWLSRD